MGSVGEEQFEYVHYHDGGVPGCRPILAGKHAKPTFNELPMIDMRRMFSSSLKDRQELAAEVGKACREVGFFYALNHDVPDEVIDSTFDAVAKFFALPEEVKMEAYMRNSSIFRGYEPMLSIQLDPTTRGDLKEAFLMGEDPSEPEQKADLPHDQQEQEEKPRNQWPSSPSAAYFRPALYRYYSHVRAFARRLLGIFALALDLPEDYFDGIATFPMAGVRAIHYPPQEVSSDVGIGAHTDYSWFTLVCQTAPPALEVLNGNGIWVPAKPTPRTFVVNIGDFLKLVTGGTWLSTVHRVRNMTGAERYSMPFFFSPNEDSCIKVLEAFRDPVKSYDDISVRDYYDQRLKAARKENAAQPTGSNQMSRSVAVAS